MNDYPFTSHYVPVSGGRMHYIDEGDGPVITMLHGNPTWSYYFRHLIRILSKDFRVIVPDHLGCGLSDKPGRYDYTLEEHIENLKILLEHLAIDSTSLVVHDWGGAIGMGYATRFVDQIEKVVILNTAAFRSTRIPLRIRICRWPLLGKFLVCGLNGFSRAALYMAVVKRLRPSVAAAYLAPYNSWNNRAAVYGFVKDIPLSEKHVSYQTLTDIENGLEQLRKRRVPMIIIWGGRDFCFNDQFYDEWRRRFPEAAYHYLEGCGHYILEDGHTIVEPLVEEFFGVKQV
jgi:pimeloyl-ACP methyl ester carboxylesterase